MVTVRILKVSNMAANYRTVVQLTSEMCEGFGVSGSDYWLTTASKPVTKTGKN